MANGPGAGAATSLGDRPRRRLMFKSVAAGKKGRPKPRPRVVTVRGTCSMFSCIQTVLWPEFRQIAPYGIGVDAGPAAE